MAKSKKIILTAVLSSALLHLVIFLMYFIPYYAMEANVGSRELEIYEYIRTFVTRFLDFSIPVVACAVVYFSDSAKRIRGAALSCLFIALGRLFYLLPYYYLWFMEISGRADSGEALIMACASSLLNLAFFWTYLILLYALLRFVANRTEYAKAKKALTPQMRENLSKKAAKEMILSAKTKIDEFPRLDDAFDFSNSLCAGLFALPFTQFIIYFIQEVITTIQYLMDFAGSYRMEEIIYMIVSFLFIFASMFATHLINCKLGKVLKENKTVDN